MATREQVIRRASRGEPLAAWAARCLPGPSTPAAAARAGRARRAAVPRLSPDERRQVLAAITGLVEGLYAHLPLKRARYATDPLQRLRLLSRRVEQDGADGDDADFHAQLSAILTGLRDAHTRYIGPAHLEGHVAFLPFLVEAFGATPGAASGRLASSPAGGPGRPRYLVSKVARGVGVDPDFAEGVEILWWNAVPIDRAVDLRADQETGGRPDSRRARAVENLTLRALRYSPPPDELWVDVGYRAKGGAAREARFDWRVLDVGGPAASQPSLALEFETAARLAYAVDSSAETVRAAKKLLYAPDVWYADKVRRAVPERPPAAGGWLETELRDVVAAKAWPDRSPRYGYLRLWSFNVGDDKAFVAEVARLLRRLPDRGLVIDLRGNPGGLIPAAERLLQLFTPTAPAPTRFSFLATPLTNAMAHAPQNELTLARWRASLAGAVESGELYSQGVPITDPGECYDVGQVYGGPVVAVVDANTYSAGDLFAAGFVDNAVGRLVTVGSATGAGGANVWSPGDVAAALAGTGFEPQALPAGIGYTISARRATRTGTAEGSIIEDVGVAGDARYAMTRNDLVRGNRDLLKFCAGLLADMPATVLRVGPAPDGVAVTTAGLDEVEVRVGGSTAGPGPVSDGTVVHLAPADAGLVEVLGYAGGRLVQRRRLGLRE